MTETPDKHSHSAEALKALSRNPREGGDASPDGFVGPEEAEVLEDGTIDPVEGVEAADAGLPFADPPAGTQPLPIPGAEAAPDPHARRRRAAAFDQRARKAHAHQYKTIMIPLLITLGVMLLLMGAFALFRDLGGTEARPDPYGFPTPKPVDRGSFQRWFPFLAFPLGAILLVGAWWFHRDVNRKRP